MTTSRQRRNSPQRQDVSPPRAEPAAESPDGLATKLGQWGAVIAPTTVATAMLLYFGYIATRARFAYFGVYLDLTDLSSRDLVLHGIEVLYLPTAVLLFGVLLAVGVHLAATWATSRLDARRGVLVVAGLVLLTGAFLLARAVLGLAVAHVSRDERPGSTALALAAGPCLCAYACWLAARVSFRPGRPRSALHTWYVAARRLRLTGLAATAGLALTGLFWAGTSFAWRLGEGRAYDDAVQLPARPEVIVDTPDRLTDLPPYVRETVLPADAGSRFQYRYRGLRLLIQAGGRLFLVPDHWTADGRTLILPYDNSVRLQVIPRPAP
nr:hypothetical protein [uncultured Actinoplanes sp.]